MKSKLDPFVSSPEVRLHTLSFADDIIVLSKDTSDLNVKLYFMKHLFDKLHLTLNVSKSKIMIFRPGRLKKDKPDFWWGIEPIELVNNYSYLGVLLTNRGVGSATVAQIQSKTNVAIYSTISIIRGIQCYLF